MSLLHSFYCWGSVGVILVYTIFFAVFGIDSWKWLACIWALIPVVLLLIQVLAAPFGYNWDFGVLNQQLTAIVNTLFAALAILGVVNDPTTAGTSDSAQARTYEGPKER